MKICFMCDLHLSSNIKTLQYDALDFAIGIINRRFPDAVCYVGDVTCDGDISVYRDFISKMETLGIPFLYIPGNSDLRCPESFDEIKTMASDLRLTIDGRTVWAVNDCDQTVSEETLDLLWAASPSDVVFLHHPIDHLLEPYSLRMAEWRAANPDVYVFNGHKHVSKRMGNDIWLQTLDPDKAIGEPPSITFFDTETGEIEPVYYYSSVPADVHRYMGISLYNAREQIAIAIKYKLRALELRKNCVDYDRAELSAMIAEWRRVGGENLSIHLPDVKYVSGEAVTDPRLGEYMALADLLSADRFTQHVPKVTVSEVKSGDRVLERLADAVAGYYDTVNREITIGIENMHMTAKDGEGDNRRFGYTPEECLEFMRLVSDRTRHKVGINFDIGHARNNGKISKTYQIGTWMEMVGRHIVGYHIHQVNNPNGGTIENHLAINDFHGRLISFGSFFRAWCVGMINKVPVVFEMRPEGAYETTLSLFETYRSRNVSDIHSHTYYSNCSSEDPYRSVMSAYVSGVSLFAITDHLHGIGDRIAEYGREMRSVAEHFSDRIKVLVGIELATLPYKFDPKSYEKISDFDFCLIEHIDDPRSAVGRELFDYVDKFTIPCGIAHTDLFNYCDMYGLDPREFFSDMARRGMFWEMNVSYDCTHRYREHDYVREFFENEERMRIVKEAGLTLSVAADSHDHADYNGDRVNKMYDLLKKYGFKTIDEKFGGYKK